MKKTIKIAHLYYDILNLYGENGNIMALQKFISRQGVSVTVEKLSIQDRIEFKKYDMFYMGSGSEDNLEMVLCDLQKYTQDIISAIDDDKVFLVTGNALEIFGKKIKFKNGRILNTLGIFDFNVNEMNNRIVGEIFYRFKDLEGQEGNVVLGFKNCNGNIVNNNLIHPFGFEDNIRYKNFFGMLFFGPVLIRNPHFTDYLLKILFKNKKMIYKEDNTGIEYEAYQKFIENFGEYANLD